MTDVDEAAPVSPTGTAPPLSLRDRLYSTPAIHRLVPARVGIAYARRRMERWWGRSARARGDARLQMEFLTGVTDDKELDDLGRRYMFEMLKREEMDWRMWLTTRIPVDGLDILRDAQAAGGGVILNFVHHGQFHGLVSSIARHGLPIKLAYRPYPYHLDTPPYKARRAGQRMATRRAFGTEIFPATNSYAAMRERLERGETVQLASDMPGRNPVSFMGRSVGMAAGAARLAIETGAPILPVTAHRGTPLQRFRILEPVPAVSGEGHQALLRRLITIYEPAIRDWPEAVERPLTRSHLLDEADLRRFGDTPADKHHVV